MFKILAQVFLLVVCIPHAQLMLMKVRNQENNFLLNLQRGDEMPYNGNAPWANAPQILSLEETMEHDDTFPGCYPHDKLPNLKGRINSQSSSLSLLLSKTTSGH